MNKVILMGNLTRNPEVRHSQSANPVAVARYGLAVRRQFAKQGDTDVDFFNIVAFGKAGEFAEKFFKKGQKVAIIGRLQQNTWDDHGTKRTSIEVVVEEQHLAESKKSAEQHINEPNVEQNAFTPTIEEDDDLPF